MSTLEFNTQMIGFSKPLRYFAFSLTSNSDDADDLLQETMLKAIRYKDKFTDTTNLKAWLYTIMKNTFINEYRRKAKSQQIIDNTKESYFINVPQTQDLGSPISQISHRDILKEIWALEEDLRVPFERFFEGYKYKEIADELNVPIGTVKSRIFLARKKLMHALKDFR
jgi:RNA polymerase sigma factor (sigma-70 family)